MLYIRIVFLALFLLPVTVLQAQDRLKDFDTARQLFWGSVYSAGGWTLYCGLRFEAEGEADKIMATIDHIYSMPRVYEDLGCRSRLQCKQTKPEQYNRIEADLHNMYPATGELVVSRTDTVFGEVDADKSRYADCDFERHRRVIEPRDIAKGNIARSLLYMREEYGLALPEDLELLKAWSREDPPSEQEINRNDVIEKLQGNRNPFIDHPEQVQQLE